MAIKTDGLSSIIPQFLADLHMGCDVTGPGTVQIGCFRGCQYNGSDLRVQRTSLDQYSDVLWAFGQKPDGDPFAAYLQGTARPGAYWVKHPSYSKARGCPTLQPGQYPYRRGPHKGKPAMNQAGRVVVIRDGDDDSSIDPEEAYRPDYGATAINIHAGGSTALPVGIWSSGCQAIAGGWSGKPWRTFHDIVYKLAAGQNVFRYALVDYGMFCQWWNRPQDCKPQWVMYGSSGQDVLELQQRLVDSGYLADVDVTGKWGMDTDLAYRRYQRKALGMKVPDGLWMVTP
jgi:hypothetical protein